MERLRIDPAQEPAFFRRLLEATVYVHVPVSDDSKNLRLVQFRHPDGFDAIPFFTSLQKARFASSRAVRIVELEARELLSQTRGATLMLNPNDGGAVLYPEEIASLLDTGFMARIEKIEHPQLEIRPATSVPAWLIAAVRDSAQATDYVDAAFIVESRDASDLNGPLGLVIYLVVDPSLAERAARLVTAAVQPLCTGLNAIIDIMIHDRTLPLPEHLTQPGVIAIYDRTAG